MTTATMPPVDDAELVSRALSGDQTAVAEMYDRYADAIYSFCRSRLRNDADAADATQDTFVRAATKLAQLREPEKLRSWLYAIARNQIIATGRQSGRFGGDEEMELVVAPDSEPDIDLLRVEAASQLWDAADGLSPRDHEVLELHLRHGLVGQGLADALGVTESHANVLLSRMRDRIGTALGSLLVAREGRDNCFELDLLLGGWDGRFTLDIRSKVTRHVKACDICEQTHTRVLASGVSFGVLPILPAPSGLRVGTIGKMADSLGINSAGSASAGAENGPLRFSHTVAVPPDIGADRWEWQPDGFPGAVASKARRGTVLLSAAAVFVALVVLGGVTALVFNKSDATETAASVEVAGAVETTAPPASIAAPSTGVEVTPAPTTTDTTAPTTTTEVAEGQGSTTASGALATTPPTTAAPTTATPTTATPTTAAPTTATPTTEATTTAAPTTQSTTTSSTTTSTTTEAPPPPNEPPIFARVAASPAVVEVKQGAACQGQDVTVIVVVTDPDGAIDSVIVTWQPGNGQTETSKLQPTVGAGPNTFVGTIGPWFDTGRQSSSITATDDDGDSTTTRVTVSVTGCPAG